MKYLFILSLLFLVCIPPVHAAPEGYIVEPYSPQPGPTDTSGADGTETFWDQPLWIQAAWTMSVLAAGLGALKFGPLVFGKVKILLQNKNYSAILKYIQKNPGCTITDLSEKTGINRGTTKYHLYLLILERKVVWKKYAKHRYLFANGGMHIEKKQLYGYIRNPVKHAILTLIQSRPGISNKEIAGSLQISRSTVYWHLRQFIEGEMVVSQWDGRYMNYFLVPEAEDIIRKNRK